jgi:hypothetical protein
MVIKKRISGTKKAILILSGIFIILLLITIIIADNFVEKKLRERIDQQFNNNPGSVYSIEVEKIGISVFRASVVLENIAVSPKEFIMNDPDSVNDKSFFDVTIDSYELKGLAISKYFDENILIIEKVEVKGTQINYYHKPNKEKQKSKSSGLKSFFSKDFKGAVIKNLDIIDASVRFANAETKSDPWFEIDSLSLRVKDIKFDSLTVSQALPLSFSDLSIETRSFSVKSMKYNNVSTSEIHFNIKDSTLLVNGFSFIPSMTKDAYNKQIAYENDLFLVKADQICFKGLNIKDIIENKRIILKYVEIQEVYAGIYRDKTLPDPPYKEKLLFAGLVRKIPLTTHIDSLLILNSEIVYEEKQKLSDIPGKVNFDKLNLRIFNISNDSLYLSDNDNMRIILDARLMGQGNMKVWINVDLNSIDDKFKATGLLGPIPAIAFNKLTKNLLLAEIKLGAVQGAWFSFVADKEESFGELKIDYEDLKIVAWKLDKEKQAKFLTFVGNKLIRKSNLKTGKNYRTGVISFKRFKDRGIPNYLWKSVQSGIISIIAPLAENKKQREVVKQKKKEKRKAKKEKNKSEK